MISPQWREGIRELYDFDHNLLSRMNKNAIYTNSQRRTIDADSIRLGRNSARFQSPRIDESVERVSNGPVNVRKSQSNLEVVKMTSPKMKIVIPVEAPAPKLK